MNNSRFTKSVSIVMVIAGFLLFTATWLSHAFWRFVSSLGLANNDLAHPIFSWLGLAIMAVGLFMLYRQTSLEYRSAGKLAFIATAVGITMAVLFTLGLVIPMPMSDTIGPVLAWLSFLLMFAGGWISIVHSLRNAKQINETAHQ